MISREIDRFCYPVGIKKNTEFFFANIIKEITVLNLMKNINKNLKRMQIFVAWKAKKKLLVVAAPVSTIQ